MDLENYKRYRKERLLLVREAEKIQSADNFNQDDFNNKIKEIEKIDLENKHLEDKYKKEFDDFLDNKSDNAALDQANKNAIEGKNIPTNQFFNNTDDDFTVIDSTNNYTKMGGNKMSLFLNKSDKLSDRVKQTDKKSNDILKQDGALGEVIRGVVTGKWENNELKNIVTTTSTGVLIPQILSAEVIDLAREQSLFTNAGVRIIPMKENNMTISKITKDPIFSFKQEGEAVTENSFEIDGIELKSKTAYGYAYVSLESIKSSQNLDSIIRQTFAQAMANTIDNAFIYGQYNDTLTQYDDFAPSGIMNDLNVNSVVATTNGGYDDIIKAIGKVRQANGTPTAYGINANTEELLSLLKTTDGQYLQTPKAVSELNQIVSNQLKYDETEGSDALVFDPRSMIIGMQNDIQIKIIEDGECLKKGLVGFQIYSMLDCQAVQPKHICKVTGIK